MRDQQRSRESAEALLLCCEDIDDCNVRSMCESSHMGADSTATVMDHGLEGELSAGDAATGTSSDSQGAKGGDKWTRSHPKGGANGGTVSASSKRKFLEGGANDPPVRRSKRLAQARGRGEEAPSPGAVGAADERPSKSKSYEAAGGVEMEGDTPEGCSRRVRGTQIMGKRTLLPTPPTVGGQGGGAAGQGGRRRSLAGAFSGKPRVDCPYRREYDKLREQEATKRPEIEYLNRHDATRQHCSDFLNDDMRAQAASWLVEVALQYNLQQSSLFLAISHLDRFLSSIDNPLPRGLLQLACCACILVASKQEEIQHLRVDDLVYIADNSFKRPVLLDMERRLLNTLSWEMYAPTAIDFFGPMVQVGGRGSAEAVNLAMLISELALIDYEFIKYPPSAIAAASLCYAQHLYRVKAAGGLDVSLAWPQELAEVSGYSLEEVSEAVEELWELHRRSVEKPGQFSAVTEKYARDKSSAQMLPPEGLGR